MITVGIPVGPNKAYKSYFQECVDSLKIQTVPPSEVLVVDDMAGVKNWKIDFGDLPVRIHENPWRVGVPCAFNFCVALAANELVIMLGSDDKLNPWAIEDCLRSYNKHKIALGYYWCDVEYNDGETQAAACNCAMVTKKLWRRCGGFPPESAVGACDSMLLSILLVNKEAGTLVHVESEHPPFWYRRHGETVTAKSGDMQGPIFTVRDSLARNWTKPKWTKVRLNGNKSSSIR